MFALSEEGETSASKCGVTLYLPQSSVTTNLK